MKSNGFHVFGMCIVANFICKHPYPFEAYRLTYLASVTWFYVRFHHTHTHTHTHTIPLYHTSPELWKPLAHANFTIIVRWAISDVCDFKYVNFKHTFGFEISTWTGPDPDPRRHMVSLGHNDLKRTLHANQLWYDWFVYHYRNRSGWFKTRFIKD